jgi:hypothetical protein
VTLLTTWDFLSRRKRSPIKTTGDGMIDKFVGSMNFFLGRELNFEMETAEYYELGELLGHKW